MPPKVAKFLQSPVAFGVAATLLADPLQGAIDEITQQNPELEDPIRAAIEAGEGQPFEEAMARLEQGLLGTVLGAAGDLLIPGLRLGVRILRAAKARIKPAKAEPSAAPKTTPEEPVPQPEDWTPPVIPESKAASPEGVLRRVYHGTKNVFEKFDKKMAKAGLFGDGFYFTENPKVASGYSATSKASGVAPNVRVAYLDIRNPFNADGAYPADEAFATQLAEKLNSKGFDGDYFLERVEAAEEQIGPMGYVLYDIAREIVNETGERLGSRGVNEILGEMGYDGITHLGGEMTEGLRHRVWVVFDENQIIEPPPLKVADVPGGPKPGDAVPPLGPDVPRTPKKAIEIGDPNKPALSLKPGPLGAARLKEARETVDRIYGDSHLTRWELEYRANLYATDIELNLENLRRPEDIKNLMRDAAKIFREQFEKARRGERGQDISEAAARDIERRSTSVDLRQNPDAQAFAKFFGLGTVDDLVLERPTGTAYNAEETLAAARVWSEAARILDDIIRESDSTAPSGTEQVKFRRALAAFGAISAEIMGIRAEAGRALNIWNRVWKTMGG
ncbi:MAG: hypothetical protein L0170_00210, partial [Acidobacteria bacterium]|nr:hypothetical protein [Acidobacteriota bacterium]